MADQLSFTEWLNEEMRKRKMSQAELARKSGLGRSVINKMVNRMIKRPDPSTYVAIAKALDVSPVTVFRIAGILPPDPDLPILEEYKTVLINLSPERRREGLELIKTLAEFDKTAKGSSSQE